MVYEGEASYIVTATDVNDRITRLRSIITALENQMIIAAADAGIDEYSMNDGQVTIRTKYRDPEAIAKAIEAFTKILDRLIAKSSGTRIISLRDAKSFNLLP